MAIDSEVKRKSIAAIGFMPVAPVVVPDSTIDNPDRQAIGYSYSGIAASGAAPANAIQLINNEPLTRLIKGVLVGQLWTI